MLHPAGAPAEQIASLWWLMFGILAVVFVIVIALTLIAVFRRPGAPDRPPPLGNRFIIISGIILPAIIVIIMLIYSVGTTVALRMPETEITVRVIGHRWWWEVEYPQLGIVSANEIYIPVGRPVRLELLAADVIHSFWVPQLQGKMDMLPEHPNYFWIQADRPGVYRGQCAEFCGEQHARMAFFVVALREEEFEQWVMQSQQPHPEPVEPVLLRGRQVFFEAGCNTCHAIRGTEADARVGPDLTHMGSRLSLGAGQLPNSRGNLAGWISNPQALKPGNEMPRTFLEPRDLEAVTSYLESLR